MRITSPIKGNVLLFSWSFPVRYENKSDLLSRLGTVFSIVYYSVFMETETTINQLPAVTKFSTTLTQFRARLNNVNFTGYQCMNGREFLSIFTFLHTLGLVNIYINNF